MLIVLAAWVFWLMLHGRLGAYAAFVTTANPQGGAGALFKGWGIPVNVNLGIAGSPGSALSPSGAVVTMNNGSAVSGVPSTGLSSGLGNYFTGLIDGLQGSMFGTGSGLPTAGQLNTLTNQANANVAAGAPGL